METDWSVPETEVMAAIRESIESDRRAVLATIIAVRGSAYRRPGAKMIVTEDGEGVGSVTAGCLEDEVRLLASEVLEENESRVETFDLTGDDDVWGLGVGCNGVIDILLEPLEESFLPIVEAYENGEDSTVLTVLESDDPRIESGARRRFGSGKETGSEASDGENGGEWPEDLRERIEGPLSELRESGNSDTIRVETGSGSIEVFLDSVTAPPELVVFGTGHDVDPLVGLAKGADFRVTVIGFRGASATDERFPEADRVLSTSPTRVREALDLDADSYTVVMTHNFIDDRLCLDELLESPVEYIGLMGPEKRFEEMIEELESEGRTLTQNEKERIYTPIGLDLGGETPVAIAQSIISEVMAVHNDREPGHLRERTGSIHDRLSTDEELQSA